MYKAFISRASILVLLCLSIRSYGYTILIDPGHGGEENGATSYVWWRNSKGKKYKHYVYEKDLTLKYAKLMAEELKRSTKYNVYLTRTLDRTVTLEERAETAEKVKADLFISIHFNSSKSRHSHGFETFYLSNHKDDAVKKVEHIENRGLMGEELVVNQILIDLIVERTTKNSKELATNIHNKLSRVIPANFKLKDRGMKPGLFYVLALSKRPAVLLETGFMSNPHELQQMLKSSFRNAYAKAVVSGIQGYIEGLKKKNPALF